MADEDDATERSEDPTQKRLDDAHERGDVAKSQEVNTWFMISGATLVLSTFSGSIGSIQTPLRNLIANSWMIRTDGPGLLMLAKNLEFVVFAALNDSYSIFSPGEVVPSGDVAALATRAFAAAFKIGMQLSAPFLVFGLVFNIGLGVLARLMPQMQVYFVGVPLSIMSGFLIFAVVIAAMMGTFLDYFIAVMHDMIPLK